VVFPFREPEIIDDATDLENHFCPAINNPDVDQERRMAGDLGLYLPGRDGFVFLLFHEDVRVGCDVRVSCI
jgi:hypothetical protein